MRNTEKKEGANCSTCPSKLYCNVISKGVGNYVCFLNARFGDMNLYPNYKTIMLRNPDGGFIQLCDVSDILTQKSFN